MLDNPVPEEGVVRATTTTAYDNHTHAHKHPRWGGLLLVGEDVPLCKHLLASLLAERWDMIGEMVEERVVGREEMAGWAAGWGG